MVLSASPALGASVPSRLRLWWQWKTKKGIMRGLPFSIASLLAAVAFVAVATSALRSATDAWYSGVFSIVLLTLFVAALLNLHFVDRRRAYWLGRAIFALVMAFAGGQLSSCPYRCARRVATS
jgi:hypothetical protein